MLLGWLDYPARGMFEAKSTDIAVVALFSSTALATSYAMQPFPNMKLIDVIVFTSAFTFGLPVGLSVAAISRFVYGTVNPYGVAGLPLLLVLVAAEFTYVFFGVLARKTIGRHQSQSHSWSSTDYVAFGALGGFSALVYDVATNAFTGLLAYPNFGPAQAMLLGLLTMNFPLPLGLIHEASNVFFFALLAPPLISAVQHVFRQRGR